MIEVTIDGLPPLPNQTKGWHWAKVERDRKDWHWRVRVAMNPVMPDQPFAFSRVTLTRHSLRAPDADNLMASWKPILDGTKHAKVIVDDSPEHVRIESRWRPHNGRPYITIRVEPLE